MNRQLGCWRRSISQSFVQEEGGKGKGGAQDKLVRKEQGRLTKLQEDLERLEARQALDRRVAPACL